ncbi:hypothetical protein [Salinarchaeum laminariae]|uniref:hypothetical protein n=1 Tax=Salinarchaeum laminariae TaxID=869888 RepID=UPI0020C0CE30|nr:hypothetical protein [Salinarchaeum laminariae]
MNGTPAWMVAQLTRPDLWALVAVMTISLALAIELASSPGSALLGWMAGWFGTDAANSAMERLD